MNMLLTTCYSESETAKPHTQAILAAKHALDLLPDSPDALNEYGYVLATNGQQLDEAVRVTSRALQLLKKEPDSPETRLTTATIEDSYGWALYGQGHFDAAANALNQVSPIIRLKRYQSPKSSPKHSAFFTITSARPTGKRRIWSKRAKRLNQHYGTRRITKRRRRRWTL